MVRPRQERGTFLKEVEASYRKGAKCSSRIGRMAEPFLQEVRFKKLDESDTNCALPDTLIVLG